MSNIIKAFINIVNNPVIELVEYYSGRNRMNNAGKALETFVQDAFAETIDESDENRRLERLEEIYYPGDTLPLYIDKKSESLKLIQQLRNEAHRFAITFHRKRRDKRTFTSELTTIKGIGPSTAQMLLKQLGSVSTIKKESLEKISAVVGKKKAELIFKYFQRE